MAKKKNNPKATPQPSKADKKEELVQKPLEAEKNQIEGVSSEAIVDIKVEPQEPNKEAKKKTTRKRATKKEPKPEEIKNDAKEE